MCTLFHVKQNMKRVPKMVKKSLVIFISIVRWTTMLFAGWWDQVCSINRDKKQGLTYLRNGEHKGGGMWLIDRWCPKTFPQIQRKTIIYCLPTQFNSTLKCCNSKFCWRTLCIDIHQMFVNIILIFLPSYLFQVFDSEGSFLSYVNTSADPLYGPQGLTVTTDGFCAVADSGNHCFKIYKYLQWYC